MFKIDKNTVTSEAYDAIMNGLAGGSVVSIYDKMPVTQKSMYMEPMELNKTGIDGRHRISAGVHVMLHSEEKTSDYLCALRDMLEKEYAIDGTEVNLNVFLDDLRYTLIKMNDEYFQIYSSDNPTDLDVLKKDIPFGFDVVERAINSAGAVMGDEFDLTTYPKITTNPRSNKTNKTEKTEVAAEKIDRNNLALGFADIGGHDSVKNELLRFSWGLQNQDICNELGLKPPRGILLYGPPGTGKTLLAKATANDVMANFYHVNGEDITNKWYGESEKNIANLFKVAAKDTPAIVFIDEIDSIATPRDSEYASEVTGRLLGTLLKYMDGIETSEGLMVLGATNRLHSIDRALLRPGRFDKLIEVPLPDNAALKQIYQIKLKGKRISDIDYTTLSAKSDGLSGADIQGVINTALEQKIDKIRVGGKPKPLSTGNLLESIAIYAERTNSLNGTMAQDGVDLYS